MRTRRAHLAAVAALLAYLSAPSHAALPGADEGKLQLTAGFNDVEGAGGGGLVPLALITSYGTQDSWGANAHLTTVRLQDFRMQAYGFAVGALDRFEFSVTKHELEVTGTALDGLGVTQNVVGGKVKLFGDSIYHQDLWIPQVSLGAQYKKNTGIHDGASIGLAALRSVKALGADDEHGVDYYLAATKVFLAQSLVLNATARYTKANQFGLLGFGGDRENGYSLEPEATVAYLVSRRLALGAEFRARPHNLSVDDEQDAWTIFAGWAPTKNVSIVAAYLNMGSILGPVTTETHSQDGGYLSIQVGF